jgi:excisionase family DNA binding protein
MIAHIHKLIDADVMAEYARAQQALLQEIAREAAEQARSGTHGPSQDGAALLTPKELAQQLSVPISWVYEQSRLGKLPTHRVGRYLRFRLSEVLEHRKRQREEHR